jgi:hypothetical protein
MNLDQQPANNLIALLFINNFQPDTIRVIARPLPLKLDEVRECNLLFFLGFGTEDRVEKAEDGLERFVEGGYLARDEVGEFGGFGVDGVDFEAHCASLVLPFLLCSELRLYGNQWLCEIRWLVLIAPRLP